MPPVTQEKETLDQTVERAKGFLAERGRAVEPTVSASQLTQPTEPVTVPEPQQAPGVRPTLNAGVRSTLLDVRRTAEGARELEQRQQELADLGAISATDISEQMQERFGVTPERLRQLEDFESQLATLDEESTLIRSRIGAAAGQTAGQAGREINQENREAAIRSAGIAAQANVLRGNIEQGRALAKDAVDLAMQDREFNANNLLNQINSLQGRVDQETEAALADQEFQVEQELATIAEVKENVAAAIASGAASQADIATMTDPNVSDAEKLALAQGIVGRAASTPEAVSPELRTVGDSLYQVDPVTGAVKLLVGNQEQQSRDPISILNSGGSILSAGEASSGGKEVSASFIESWSKAGTTLDQVEALAQSFSEDRADSSLFGEDAGIFSGIVGAVRSNNPVDVKAQTIKNQLNAIVPNLARGIYGEVGVLTDQDFDRYAQTLPNLGSTQEVQDAVLGITLMAIKNSMVNRYEAELRGGRDVSGYVSQIEDMERRIGTLLTPTNMQLPETQSLIEAGASEDEIKMLFEAGYEIEDVEDYYLNGGTSQSSGQVSFDDAIAASAEAIATIESGGNYQARGPVVTSGMYAGERAMGKYQIMPGNLPQWSREALGREVTEEEFMNSPQIQDQIFAYQFGKAAKQHGSLEDAASVWFSGRPIAKAGNAQDVLGTSVPQYVQNFRNNLQLYA